jgi:hypothetical protein
MDFPKTARFLSFTTRYGISVCPFGLPLAAAASPEPANGKDEARRQQREDLKR